ncbi:unnamed protein product [Taenia asiatica]|uniref:Exocyst complex component Sec8 n=1 Tax=Taenia asiatica TaxID=60517 RepID=A0A0R3VTL5_TAEAS|nr:unnamed protein product [Taenia asiatica]
MRNSPFESYRFLSEAHSNPTACVLNTWLRTLNLVVDCLDQLLPLAFSTAATVVAIDDTARLLPDTSLPSYLSFTLNEFMLALRIYVANFPDMQPTLQDRRTMIEQLNHRMLQTRKPTVSNNCKVYWYPNGFFGYHLVLNWALNTPILKECLQHLPDSLQLLIYSLRFQSIKVAAVKAPEILQPPKTITEIDGHPLPPILQHLGMAIEALAPSFSVLSGTDLRSSQTDLGPLVKLLLDVLQTANEYFFYGLKELAATQIPSLWLVDNIASVQLKVEKLMPFQFNNLLSTDLLQLGASSARRKAASGEICYRLLHGYLSPLDVRMIISFRLNMVRISVLSKQLANTHHSGRFVTTITEQLKASLTWLQRHLSICGGCGDADYDDALLKYEDYRLIISIVTNMVLIRSGQKDVLSESGIQHILRDTVILRHVVDALHDYLIKAETGLSIELLFEELLPSLSQLGLRAFRQICATRQEEDKRWWQTQPRSSEYSVCGYAVTRIKRELGSPP